MRGTWYAFSGKTSTDREHDVVSGKERRGGYVKEMNRCNGNGQMSIVQKNNQISRPVPRVVIAGTNSGCGKTTMVCALLKALKNRGLCAGAFKCGPDYIDPMFHSRIIGTACSNLDSFFFDSDTMRYLLSRNSEGKDVSIIEGVMGYFDGMGFDSVQGSTYDIAQITKSPVILAVNAKGAALSVLAEIYGFLHFSQTLTNGDADADPLLKGVIFNQCTAMTCQLLKQEVEKRFHGSIKVLGYLPVMKEAALESRHLGLVTAQEVEDLQEKAELLAKKAEACIEIDALLSIARQAGPVCYQQRQTAHFSETVRIAVARDRAFCFYYEDSLQLLRDLGAELVSFSPLTDASLPENIGGLYLGGGYPELYAQQLSQNGSMCESIYQALCNGLPCIAECGGFMYLTEAIGQWPQVGFLPGKCFDTGKLRRFGYVNLTARADNMLCRAGEQIPGHEFHYWDAEHTGNGFTAGRRSGRSWDCVHVSEHLYAGFPHFHFYANPGFAERFYGACLKYASSLNNMQAEK